MKLFKSRKTYYLYNPNTLNYERVYPSSKDRLFTVLHQMHHDEKSGYAERYSGA